MTGPSTSGSCQSDGRRPETTMRDCAATRTLSYTEMPGKMFVIWKVFARPRRLMTSGPRPVTSVPRKTIRPAVGACRPLMMLKSVDLPAPLGPMTENTSPSLTMRLTRDRAARAPKLFDTPSTSSMGVIWLPSRWKTSPAGRTSSRKRSSGCLPGGRHRRPGGLLRASAHPAAFPVKDIAGRAGSFAQALIRLPSRWKTSPAGRASSRKRSSGCLPAGSPAQGLAQAQEPARHEEHDQDQHHADHDVVPLHVRRDLLLEQDEERAADDGADERPEAADHDHDEELARDAPVQEIGRGVGRATRVERAREPGQDGRDQAHAHLVALNVVTEEARPVLVLADG